jgi:hypothetical protein
MEGALSPHLKVRDVVMGEWVLSLRKNEMRKLMSDLPRSICGFKRGGVITEGRFVHTPEQKKGSSI